MALFCQCYDDMDGKHVVFESLHKILDYDELRTDSKIRVMLLSEYRKVQKVNSAYSYINVRTSSVACLQFIRH